MHTFNTKFPGNQSNHQLGLALPGRNAAAFSPTTVASASCCHCGQLALVLNELQKLERELNIIVRAIGGMRR
jgi:hypothetical protein